MPNEGVGGKYLCKIFLSHMTQTSGPWDTGNVISTLWNWGGFPHHCMSHTKSRLQETLWHKGCSSLLSSIAELHIAVLHYCNMSSQWTQQYTKTVHTWTSWE